MTNDDRDYIEELENRINKLTNVVNWLTIEIANNNTRIGKLNGEVGGVEDWERNMECFLNKLKKLLA